MQINCFPSRITGKPSSLGLSPKTVNNQQFKISLNPSQGRASTEKQKKTSSIFPPQTFLLFFLTRWKGLLYLFSAWRMCSWASSILLDIVTAPDARGTHSRFTKKKWARFGLEKRSFLVEWQWSCFYQWKFRCTTHTHSRRATDDWHSLARLSSSIDKKNRFSFLTGAFWQRIDSFNSDSATRKTKNFLIVKMEFLKTKFPRLDFMWKCCKNLQIGIIYVTIFF